MTLKEREEGWGGGRGEKAGEDEEGGVTIHENAW